MPTTITLDPNGPRTPDRAAELAAALPEVVRVLNHLTAHPDTPLAPADVYDLIGHLADITRRLPQLVQQLGNTLHRQAAAGRVGTSDDTDPDMAVAAVSRWLRVAVEHTDKLRGALDESHEAASTLYRIEGGRG